MRLIWSAVGAVSLASVVSASFKAANAPKCWRQCARDVGIKCQWSDYSCLCKAANNGLLTAANTCACSGCGSDSSPDLSSVQAYDLSIACMFTFSYMTQATVDRINSDSTCSQNEGPDDSGWPTPVPIPLFLPEDPKPSPLPASPKAAPSPLKAEPPFSPPPPPPPPPSPPAAPSPQEDLWGYTTGTTQIKTSAWTPSPIAKSTNDGKVTYETATMTVGVSPLPLGGTSPVPRMTQSAIQDAATQSMQSSQPTSSNSAEMLSGLEGGWMGAVLFGLWGLVV